MRALAVVMAAAVSACYEYIPPPSLEAPPAGHEVRLVLTDAGSIAAASAVGPRVESIDGRVIRIDADTVAVAATQTTQQGGIENTWNGERVAVPRSAVASLQVRQLNTTRTALAAAGAIGVAAAAIIGFKTGSPGNGAGTIPLPNPK